MGGGGKGGIRFWAEVDCRGHRDDLWFNGRCADCKSAIRQIKNLRYGRERFREASFLTIYREPVGVGVNYEIVQSARSLRGADCFGFWDGLCVDAQYDECTEWECDWGR